MWKASTHIIIPLTLAAWLASGAALDFGHVLKSVEQGISKEVLAALDPVEKGVAVVGNKLCKLLETSLVRNSKPDLSQLNLQFRSPGIKIAFNLTDAAEEIPKHLDDYDPHNKLIIIVHGFTDNLSKKTFTDLNAQFQASGLFKVLGLDAASVISNNDYIHAEYNVRYTGTALGKTLAALWKEKGQLPEEIHCIGHSLGAQICASAGKTFFNMTDSKMGRITGLDPAGPCFSYALKHDMKLKHTDATFVDVIHTDAGVFGDDAENIGHVDIYPNGGSQQPGCLTQSCCHGRAPEFYAESITRDEFYMISCNSYEDFRNGNCTGDISKMGYSCPSTTRGKYYLQTAAASPFALGKDGTRYKNNAGLIQNIQNDIADKLG